jgi:hypothetical protein
MHAGKNMGIMTSLKKPTAEREGEGEDIPTQRLGIEEL